MIVTCDACGTKFKIDTSKIKKDLAKVRCSRCKHIFSVQVKPKNNIVVLDSMEEDIDRMLPKEDASYQELSEPKENTITIEEHDEEERTYPQSTVVKPIGPKKTISKSKLVFLIMLIGAIVIGVVYYIGFKGAPKSGSSLEKPSQDLKPSVNISTQTEAYFIENVQAGNMLIVQGEVTNSSSSPISFVLLEGNIIGNQGKPLLSQRFYAGNLISKEELAQLPMEKIQARMMHREGDNLSNVHIKPGNKVPFMAVFYNLPPVDELSNYAIKFVSAEVEKPSTPDKVKEK